MLGVATTNHVQNRDACTHLFGDLINRLEVSLPEQLLCSEGDYTVLQPKISQEPLMITTVVIEQNDGRLVPVLNPPR